MQVDAFLAESAVRTPDAVALIEPSRSIRYSELDALTNRVANMLIANGVSRGDRVIIAGENSVEFVAAYFGCQRAGAVAVPMPTGTRNHRFVHAIEDCQPQACIVDPSTAADATCREALRAVRRVFVFGSSGGRPGPAPEPFLSLLEAVGTAATTRPVVRATDQDLAAIIYTSGSTGDPLGVMLAHRNIVANTRSIVDYLSLGPEDRVMCVLPFYYVYGLSLLHTHISVGGSVVIDNRFAYPTVVLQTMREQAVTGFAGVPSTFILLLSRPDFTSADLPALRYVTQAGGGMSPAKIVEWRERVPNVPFFVMYGATEASARLTYLAPSQLTRKMGSIGRSIPNVQIRVLKEDRIDAAPGEVGELVARGENIACGYWNRPEETRARFTEDGYWTGDLGYADDDGYLFLVGRRHDMIKTGAHRVGPKEIEDVVHRHPAVVDVAVVGAPHEVLGEVPVAFVSVSGSQSTDEETLRRFCQQHLVAYKVPTRFILVDELPRIPGVGKTDKVLLRSRLASQFASGQLAH